MFNIYLSGSITGITSWKQVEYRFAIKSKLENTANRYNYMHDVSVFNPIEYYNYYDKKDYYSEKQVMRFELSRLRMSDLVIVDFDNPNSLGTMSEMAIAYELKKPIVGLNIKKHKLHPWQEEMCDVVLNDTKELVDYIQYNYLIK